MPDHQIASLLFCPRKGLMTLSELQTKLALVEAKINSIMETGQEYTIVGSHTVKNPSLAELERQASLIRSRIFRKNRYTSRTQPDFN